jgi:hypothetical protein
MDLNDVRAAIETAPSDLKRLRDEAEAAQKKLEAFQAFHAALRGLREDWKDTDPGKYGPHWHAFKDGAKAWPRELIARSERDQPPPAAQARFSQLARQPCPQCKGESLEVCRYEQTEDGPFGDTWTKIRYALCIGCRSLSQVGRPQTSSGRF